MLILELLNAELDYEKKLLSELQTEGDNLPQWNLVHSISGSGRSNYYYRPKAKREKIFIHSAQTDILKSIVRRKIIQIRTKRLETNISLLETVLSNICDYGISSSFEALPKSYREAVEYLESLSGGACPPGKNVVTEVIQSENPYNRDELIHKVSNGLFVRSKNEVLIAEMLLMAGINFYYEKALKLTKVYVDSSGNTRFENETVYPDFTIYLADGTVIYWEHAGLMDKPRYRTRHFEKISLYYDNDIYPPKNLIVTMDGKGKPFDNAAVKKIINDWLLPHQIIPDSRRAFWI